jgi:hypothetical protein
LENEKEHFFHGVYLVVFGWRNSLMNASGYIYFQFAFASRVNNKVFRIQLNNS